MLLSQDFDIVKALSPGAFGRVFLVRKKNTGDFYAMKVIKKSQANARKSRMRCAAAGPARLVCCWPFDRPAECMPGKSVASVCRAR